MKPSVCVSGDKPLPRPRQSQVSVKVGACLAPEAGFSWPWRAGFQLWLFEGSVKRTLRFPRSVTGVGGMSHREQRHGQLKGKGQLALQTHQTGL